MSFYHKGNAHRISAMASKSCNAVSARDLYVPLTATVDIDENARTFTVTVVASCYFGTRINIQNIFHDMTLNGQRVNNKTINAWVSQDEPGKEIARLVINGTYNYEGKPSTKTFSIPIEGSMTYYQDVGCTKTSERTFSNTVVFQIEDIDPYYTQPATPTITGATSLDTALLVDAETTSFGEGGGRFLYVEACKEQDFSGTIKSSTPADTLTATCRVPNLQRNNKYYIRAVCANNGLISYGQVQEAYTLAASEVTDAWYLGSLKAIITVMGGNDVPVTTDVYVGFRRASDGHIDFNKRREVEGVGKFTLSNLPVGVTAGYDELYVKLVSRTASGSYASPVFTVQNPTFWGTSRIVAGRIVSITSLSSTSVRIRAEARSSLSPFKMAVYYRPVGLEEEWVKAGEATKTSVNTNVTADFTVSNLIPNYAEYEAICVVTATYQGEEQEYTSPEKNFYTIPTSVSNDTCESLDFMVQLICQTYNAIKQGNITIYMNDDTKEWCEGEDGIPTLAAIMSRINRFMHSVGCILCSMEGFIELLKESEPNQVFMGQMGWVDCDDEPIDGSVNPVISDGIYQAIDELVHQVWHYAGDYDYFAYNPLELNAQSGTATGQTAVMGNKKYKWNGSSWVEDGEPVMENFGVIHINSGRHADKAYYWFVDDWNRLDADTAEIEERLDNLESLNVVKSFDTGNYKVATFADTGDVSTNITQINQAIPTDVERDTIIIITQPERQDETHLVVYDDGDGNPIP